MLTYFSLTITAMHSSHDERTYDKSICYPLASVFSFYKCLLLLSVCQVKRCVKAYHITCAVKRGLEMKTVVDPDKDDVQHIVSKSKCESVIVLNLIFTPWRWVEIVNLMASSSSSACHNHSRLQGPQSWLIQFFGVLVP